jgi:cell wall-associated NlpC family hydrolase
VTATAPTATAAAAAKAAAAKAAAAKSAAAQATAGTAETATILGNAQSWANAAVPYVWGGASKLGADCSGFVNAMFDSVGISLGGFTGTGHGPDTAALATEGDTVALAGTDKLANAVPGEVLLFNETGAGIDHAAIYAGNGKDYEESQPGQPAHLIDVDTAHLAAIRQMVNPTTGAAEGPGVTGTYNHAKPAAAGYTGGGGTGATTPSSTSSTSSDTEQLFNTKMLVRIGIGVMAVLVLLIGLDQLAKPKNSPLTVVTEGAAHTAARAGTAAAWANTGTGGPGPPPGPTPGEAQARRARFDAAKAAPRARSHPSGIPAGAESFAPE